MGDLSRNFFSKNFKCPCCGRLRVTEDLVSGLQDWRDLVGAPIYISQGGAYRCPAKNAKTPGAAKFSYHTQGMAADCSCPSTSLIALYNLALRVDVFRNGGIGFYPSWVDKDGRTRDGFIHVDTGRQRRWGRIEGKYVSLFRAMEYEKEKGDQHDAVELDIGNDGAADSGGGDQS